ncbi:xanthine dehydrogenase family protein subunit M [Croceicoccus sp. F390]|uniref:Xanthine dehydrogenase family protein subunit M n=1 Tax=Croceicoccus esteveae TaxID=3075597 RepID=A0ABU2ZLK8_9SPHN|nr:xanthine dehydrogenase family protein subunit M [Croceicoccus sp. F390]MDT0577116.1 xanthine dehydrogenase family protein subunit M [Croceicoccus sp. F390]
MIRFDYTRAGTVQEAVNALAADPQAQVIAGGTNLIDLMKYNVATPTLLVDIGKLPLRSIEATDAGGLRIGALVTNAALAYDERIEAEYPLLSSAILAGATGQLRNAATTGGNLLQRTRCYYFYDTGTPCNKREPGTGCPAIGGVNRIHAIMGASDTCIATHPSDMCVAMAALEAEIIVEGPGGERRIPFARFHRLPGDEPWKDTTLASDELIVAVELPPRGFARHHTYLKLRDRLSYAFALVSVAVGLEMNGDTITAARLALGGVAHKPWRLPEAEAALTGGPATDDRFVHAADLLLNGAVGHEHNRFKIDLARRAIVRALGQAAAGTPQSQIDKQIR